jgi:hypothetical protein
MSGLLDLFDTLHAPLTATAEAPHFCATQLEGPGDRHLAKDADGRPVLLFGIQRRAGERVPLNYALENLRVEYDLTCRIAGKQGQPRVVQFTVLRCLSDDRGIREYFLRTMEMLLAALPADASVSDVSAAVERLVALFQAMQQPSTRSTQGLWAELFIIVHAPDSLAMLEAWHSDVGDEADFSQGEERLEVKCSGDRTRRHYFSLEQVSPPADTMQLIASLFVEQAADGTTLGQLWERVRTIAAGSAELLLKIERVCLLALGETWQEARQRAYDAQRAAESLAFYNADEIPKVDGDLPEGVSEVRFRSDLSLVSPIDPLDYRGGRGLFDACLQR